MQPTAFARKNFLSPAGCTTARIAPTLSEPQILFHGAGAGNPPRPVFSVGRRVPMTGHRIGCRRRPWTDSRRNAGTTDQEIIGTRTQAAPAQESAGPVRREKASGRADIRRVARRASSPTRESRRTSRGRALARRREERRRKEKVSSPTEFPSPLYFLLSPALLRPRRKWSRRDLNPRPSACKADALPAELRPQGKNFQIPIRSGSGGPGPPGQLSEMGARRVELRTSSLSATRSNQLSYAPSPRKTLRSP